MKILVPVKMMVISIIFSLFITNVSSKGRELQSTTGSSTTTSATTSTSTAAGSSNPVVSTSTDTNTPNPSTGTSATNSNSNNTNITYQDVYEIPVYNSSLTNDQRAEYVYWIQYKNSFYTQSGQLAKMTKYFAPEDPTYYAAIYRTGWPFYTLSGVFGFFVLAYLVLRFGFGKFTGPKQHITHFYGYVTFGLIGLGFCLALIMFALSLSNSTKIQ